MVANYIIPQSGCVHFLFMHLADKSTPLLIQPQNRASTCYHGNPNGTYAKFFFFLPPRFLPQTWNPCVIPCISSNGSTGILTSVLLAEITGLETGLLCIIISPQCFGIICESTWGWIYTTCHLEEKPLWISGKDTNISFSPSQLQHKLSGWEGKHSQIRQRRA